MFLKTMKHCCSLQNFCDLRTSLIVFIATYVIVKGQRVAQCSLHRSTYTLLVTRMYSVVFTAVNFYFNFLVL
jgi:hypothetical protein